MKQQIPFILTMFFSIMSVVIFFVCCHRQSTTDPSVNSIIGTWYLEGVGDYEDEIKTLMVINEDGTMTINAISSIDMPDVIEDVMPLTWKKKDNVLEIGFLGIEQDGELEEQDYESCQFKLENNYLELCSDDVWYKFSRIK
ncbi:MAG: hypothetical protein KBS95_07160 [Alistipes sp.]|nr:hypothetical protein [Candidatus Alistipes equi]